jgi:hypothetical protein
MREEAHEAGEQVPTMLASLAKPARCLRIRRDWSVSGKSGSTFPVQERDKQVSAVAAMVAMMGERT